MPAPAHPSRRAAGRAPRPPRVRVAVVLAALCLTGAAGCREERIISRKGLLSSLPGAQSGIPDGRTVRQSELLRTPRDGIRQTDEAGEVTLYARSVQHLMSHIVSTMQNEERDLFTEQVLSKKTRDEFRIRGHDPATAYDEIVRRQRDVFRLFNVMPFGEHTPGVFLRPNGPNEFRLQIPRSSFGDLKWTGIDVVFEDGNYRLRWFTGR